MIVYARAPNRILDIGGWSDTAFAEHGAAWNCAIEHYTRVMVRPGRQHGILLSADGKSIAGIVPAPPIDTGLRTFTRTAANYFGVDDVEISVRTDVPPGCGAGTRAASRVAIAGALAYYAGQALYPHHLALIVHHLQTEEIGVSDGVQHYLAAAVGGASCYRLEPFPRVFIEQLPEKSLAALESRLVLVLSCRPALDNYYQQFEKRCRAYDRRCCKALWHFRALPALTVRAIEQCNWPALGLILTEGARLQQEVFPARRTPELCHITTLARRHHALAVVLNGSGGSVTALCSTPEDAAALSTVLDQAGYPLLPTRIARTGLQTWNTYEARENKPTSVKPLTAYSPLRRL